MAKRGLYARGRAKRAEILDMVFDLIEREGYGDATLKQVAEAAGLTQNGILHYFGTKDALFAEVLRRRDEILAVETAGMDRSNLVSGLLASVEYDSTAPGLSNLTLRVTAEATDPEHDAHQFIAERIKSSDAVVRTAIADLIERGEIERDIDAATTSALIFSAIDGLRMRRLYEPELNMRAHLAYLLRALGLPETTEQLTVAAVTQGSESA